MKAIVITLIYLILAVACSNQEQPTTLNSPSNKSGSKQTLSSEGSMVLSPQHTLLVFVNPNGGPCMLQNNILGNMAEELQGKIVVQHVQTTISADLAIFNNFGIRALPTIVLADKNGKEVKRMSPGVKSAEDIRALLQFILHS